jgi:branched-chain amino acid transport system substrate-binding protein
VTRAAWVAVLLTACAPARHTCAVVAFVGATPHAVEGDVAARILAARATRTRACIRTFRHPTYQAVGTPDAEIAMAQRVTAMDDVVAVVGHATSSASLAVAPVYRDSGVVQLVPAGTSRALRQFRPWVLTFAPNDSAEGLALARMAQAEFHPRTALVMYARDDYGEGLRQGLDGGLAAVGVRPVAELPVDEGSDLATLARAALASGHADVAFLLGDYRLVGDLAQALHAGRPGLPIMAGDAALYPQGLAEHAGPALGVLQIVSFPLPDGADSASTAFLSAFRAVARRDPTPDEALTYDALMVAAAAVDSAGASRTAVRDWLLALGGAHPAWPGVSGPVAFAGTPADRFELVRIDRGVPVPVAVSGP